jgi:hypothetical protein
MKVKCSFIRYFHYLNLAAATAGSPVRDASGHAILFYGSTKNNYNSIPFYFISSPKLITHNAIPVHFIKFFYQPNDPK